MTSRILYDIIMYLSWKANNICIVSITTNIITIVINIMKIIIITVIIIYYLVIL